MLTILVTMTRAPDQCHVKQRMMHSTSLIIFRRRLVGPGVGIEIQANDVSEVRIPHLTPYM